MTRSPRTFLTIALTALVAVTLSGCLVKKEAPKPLLKRKSDNLLVYQRGDWIQYNVLASVLGSGTDEVRTGTLKISWGDYSTLQSPDGREYDVIEKLITVNMDNGGTSAPITTRHYVWQDPDGTEKLIAMGHPNSGQGQYYWLNTTGGRNGTVNNVPGGQEAVTIFNSPLSVGQNYTVEYFLMDDCVKGQAPGCQSDVGQTTRRIEVVGDSTPIYTNLGNYANPFQINFSGSVSPTGDNQSLPLLFSIFDICSDGFSTHMGSMVVVPEIGIVQLSNTCIALDGFGDSIRYDLTLDTTSSSIIP